MKSALLVILSTGLLAAAAFGQSAPEIAFDSTPDFFKLPDGMYFGEVSGIAVNSKKHVFVLSRGNSSGPAYGAAAAQLLEFDAGGKFVREIGKNLYAWSYAHAVRVDRYDNIWVADKGSDMVVRFDPQGRVTRVFGRKPEASDEGAHPLEHPKPPLPPIDGMFRQVTDMAWDWGEPGSGPGQFNTLHAIAIDLQNRIYVADRGNVRIQVLDTSGKLLNTIKIDVPAPPNSPVAIGNRPSEASPGNMHPGAPWALCITPGPVQYLYVSDGYPGRIYKLSLDGKVLGWLGGSGKTLKKFGWVHEIACPSENEIYVAEVLNWRAQKLTLHP